MGSIHYNEKGKFFTDVISKEAVLAWIQTSTHMIKGYVHVRSGERVKDELDRDEPFLAVTDAVVINVLGEEIHSCDFISINRRQIIWLIPDDEKRVESKNG